MTNIKTTIAASGEKIHEIKNLHVLANFTAVILATLELLLNDRTPVNNDISILKFSIIFEYFSSD